MDICKPYYLSTYQSLMQTIMQPIFAIVFYFHYTVQSWEV